MPAPTLYRLAEETLRLLSGGNIPAAKDISISEIKIAIGQVINKLLKIDYLNVNMKTGEAIPNGSVLGLYENIPYTSYKTGMSKATLPIKPLKLPRNMGVFSVFLSSNPQKEFIPMQMGQANLINSQAMINDVLGQVAYENFGMELVFNKDLALLFPSDKLSMRLAILDASLYDDYDILPIPPEMEWDVKSEVYKLYSTEPLPDKSVDATTNEENKPTKQ